MNYNAQQYSEFVNKLETDFPVMFENAYGGVCTGPGWWPIIRSLCSIIDNHIKNVEHSRKWHIENGEDEKFWPELVEQVTVAQIKEKFGGLRFYYDGGDEFIRGAVHMAEYIADQTCEECGAPGKRRSGGWIRTLCDVHEAERQASLKK